MKHIIRICLLLTLFGGGLALAADLEQSKRDGVIGERADGYLGLVVENAAADVAALVKDINDKRREEYRRIAAENNLTMEQVQALAGKKTIERTRSGDWILLNGGWQKK
ncbi:MAG: YdbL family protein [Pseudomonadales bacterium]|nr:YdbL family protein [Pseudomonadales bacterium]